MCFFFQFLFLFWKSYPSIHAPHSIPLLVGFATLISYYSHKNSYFGKTFCQKNNEVISASVHWTNHINENAVTRVLAQITYKMYLFESICGEKISLKVVYWWIVKIKMTEKEGKYYLLMECSVSTTKTSKRSICILQMLITIMTAGWV